MRNRIIIFSGLSLFTLAILFAFNNCSSQKGPNAVDKALSSTSPTPTPSPSPGTTPAATGGDSEVPAGAIMAYMTSTCPSGWLAADGSAIMRSAFSNLFNIIGSTYGAGDGSTTFNLPDLRGYFLRGVDNGAGRDPDAAARTDRGDGTVGDNVGTKQSGEIQSHSHGRIYGLYDGISPGGGDSIGGRSRFGYADIAAAGGSETRPKNISVLYCISTGGQ